MACLFCLKILPKGNDHEFLEETVTTSNGGEFTLKISLNNPGKNLGAFNCLCSLLKVKWQSSEEDDDDAEEDNEDNYQKFDIRQPLPLCRKCQQGYQEVYQLYQQIKELEVLMMKRVKMIKKTMEDTQTGGLKLTCVKLNEFRRMVLASPSSNLLESSDHQMKAERAQDKVKSEPVSDDDDHNYDDFDYDDNSRDSELTDPSFAIVIPTRQQQRRSCRIPRTGQNKPNTSNLKSHEKYKKQYTSISGWTSTKKVTAPDNTPKGSVTSSLPSRSMSPRRNGEGPSPIAAPNKKLTRDRRSKLEQVTESTPRVHIDCYTCCYCGLRLKTTGGLSQHRKFHEPRKFECPICHKMFATNFQMQRHLKGVHKTEKVHVATTPPAPEPTKGEEAEESSDASA